MKKIVFYISGFGYGHLTRSIALIQELFRQQPDISITVKCHSQHMLWAKSLAGQFPSLMVQPFDIGFQLVSNAKTGKVDFTATLRNVNSWLDRLEEAAARELAAVKKCDYSLVLSDIVPEAFFVGAELGIPAVGISNFTWYELCREYVGANRVAPLKTMYQKATVFFEYPLSTGEEIPISNRRTVGLVSRFQDQHKALEIRKKYKRPGRLLLFLSIGGALNMKNLSLPQEFDYVYTRGIDLAAAGNAALIPDDTLDTQNYLAACDGVITKCGWSTVSEALIAEKPIYLLASQFEWLEEKYMLKELAGLGISRVITPAERDFIRKDLFQDIESLHCGYMHLPERYHNQIREIAAMVLQY
ncbi:MAG: UDP-N-acetylglucosamine:LPS N-acetylglucosamine transferase [Firmicutes bacterium]|nr:UDP-N-acetylglucosamine:LPS N-acetylglucosamine transferase [Bacillota bacterium]